jgi:hypothetical protein
MTLTRQLRDRLIASGRLDPRGSSRALTVVTCRNCGRAVARGLDADVCGLLATVDLTEIDPAGEVLALATGRRTYDVIPGPGRLELAPRRAAHIRARRRYPVLAEHRCDAPPLPAAPADTPDAAHGDDRPPF